MIGNLGLASMENYLDLFQRCLDMMCDVRIQRAVLL